MAQAMTLISSQTLVSTATTVTFSSISSTYRDLYLVVSAKDTTTAGGIGITFNGDNAANYHIITAEAQGSGSPTSSYSMFRSNILTGFNYQTMDATNFDVCVIHVLDSSATDKNKTILIRGNNSTTSTGMVAGRWASNAAVTSIVLSPNTSFAVGSTFTLYGVLG